MRSEFLVPFQAEDVIGREELIQIPAAGVEAGHARMTRELKGIIEVKLLEILRTVQWPVLSHIDPQ